MEDTLTPDGQLRAAARNLAHAIALDTDATRRAVAALCDRVTSEQHLLRLREIQDAHRVVNRLRNWQRDAEIRGRHLRLHLRLGKLLADFVVNPHPWVRRTVAAAAIQAFPEHLMEGVCIPHHPVPGTGASAIVFARQAIHYAFLFGHDESDIIGSLETPSPDVARYRYVTGSPLEDSGRYLVLSHRLNQPRCQRQITAYPKAPSRCENTARVADAVEEAVLAIPDDFGPGHHAGRVSCAWLWNECREWQRAEILRRLRTASLQPLGEAAADQLTLLPEALLTETASVQAFVRDHRGPRAI